jgi:hypothetical protein
MIGETVKDVSINIPGSGSKAKETLNFSAS